MGQELIKPQKRRLREWMGVAYERELAAATAALLAEFRRWEAHEMDVFQLNERIHAFHSGVSRTLYGKYVGTDPAFGVASAITMGLLTREEIGDELFSLVEKMVNVLSSPEFS